MSKVENRVQELWDEAVAQGIRAEKKESGNNRYSFRNTISGMANDVLQKYSDEMISIFNSRGDVVVDSYDKLVDVVNRAFDEPKAKATAYFGVLPYSVLSDIENAVPNIPTELNGQLFKKGRAFSIAATFDSIRHINEGKTALTRQDIIDYLDRLPDTIIENDSVSFDYYYDSYNQKTPALLFKKTFADGTVETFDLISNGKRSLKLQTIYMEKGDYKKEVCQNPAAESIRSPYAQSEGRSNFY